MIWTTLYLLSIVAANLTVARFGPSISIITAFFLIAFDLTCRDNLHEAWRGNRLLLKMAMLIAAGSLISFVINRNAGPIALASMIAFALSNAVDAIVYQTLSSKPYLFKANASNLFGAAVDSLIFPIIAFGLPVMWLIVIGQFIAKFFGGAIWSLLLNRFKH